MTSSEKNDKIDKEEVQSIFSRFLDSHIDVIRHLADNVDKIACDHVVYIDGKKYIDASQFRLKVRNIFAHVRLKLENLRNGDE